MAADHLVKLGYHRGVIGSRSRLSQRAVDIP